MKAQRINPLLIVLVIFFVFVSCTKDEELLPADDGSNGIPDIGDDAENIPQWIYDEMSFFYFWNEELPNEGPTGDEDPETYFYSLLEPSDRFSYISDDAESIKEEITGTITAMGFSPSYGIFTNSDNLFAVVEYVYLNSPAEKAGLRRGDIILKINGEYLNSDNFLDLTSTTGFSVTLGDYNGSSIVETNEVVSIGTGIIDLDPIIHYEVKESNGIKIGYLVFVDFISGEEDRWLNRLGDVLGDMKAQGISEFVLDLRYNPGGEIQVAEYLASALAPTGAVSNEEVLVNFEYNDELQTFFLDRQGENSPNLVSRFRQNENNLDLEKIYILTTGNTASASELVINGLEPYMGVTIIGEPTFGKFYGSFVLYDENDPPAHNWAISPVALKYANANGVTDFVNGLSPDVFFQDDLLNAKEFGDESDPMLATALSLINGSDISSMSRISSGRMYEPVYDLKKINKKNAFFHGSNTFERSY